MINAHATIWQILAVAAALAVMAASRMYGDMLKRALRSKAFQVRD